MKLFWKKLILFFAVFLILAKLIVVVMIFLYPKIMPLELESANIQARELIELTNQYRQENNLPPLTVNPRLTQAAVNKAMDLLNRQYFAHTAPDGKKFSEWIKEVDYDYFYVGENLAIDFENNKDIFQAWLNSPTHQENILKPQYQEIGIAALAGKYRQRATVVVVQLFGSRVLGAENTVVPTSATSNQLDHYFDQTKTWHQFINLTDLEKINKWLNYLIMIFIGSYLIIYAPPKNSSQIIIKTPTSNRYQAKIFSE